ncbi:exosome complex exonuclease Rrp6 [Pyrenophora seminiperda CCB06]|uniref:Exosome complex exonuclease Rrp6 n=1 Tax=Pyrenophora seminiperda CCB06 TaxID=1302712 RepID=A0A3M7M814_9PLEO|nr:exosome complex exonuclease Rrp6 [Pyrenophora seminiperda CCB06]
MVVGTQLDAQNARLLHIAQRLLENAAASSDAVGPKLPDVEAIDTNWRGVVDVIDSLLEKADTSLDEYTGLVRRLSPAGEQAAVKPRPNIADKKIIPKPQLNFEHVPTNNETGGFRPLLTSKPHAKIPLEECLKTFKDKRGREQYPHPYQTEIESYKYPSAVYENAEPQQYPPFEHTTATLVDTPEALAAMLSELKTAKEIAIDLEHHDNRTYIGMVCLMQISTRDKDWIVDTLKPWRRKLECLNQVFADPSILKVLHGAFMDIVWLQRDLGLYIVGLFDTFHAARALGYQAASLAYLLELHVGFKAQKQYQLADWRQRPLSKELFEYARADTHFLLYIYDNMRNELVNKSDFSDAQKNKVHDVLQNSRDTSLKRYEHPIYDSTMGLGTAGWYKLISRTPAQFTREQFSVFRAVHEWRDTLGRKKDESPLFIMPNHAVFSVARDMPSDKVGLFNAIQHVGHIIRAHADELLGVVAEAKERGASGPELHEVLQAIADMQRAERAESETATKIAEVAVASVARAPTLTRHISTSTHPTSISIQAVRAPASAFWGKLSTDIQVSQERKTSPVDMDLALPLPPLTAQIFAHASGTNQTSPKAEKAKHTFVPKDERPAQDERTDTFVVKHLGGRKRKRGDAPEEPTASTLSPNAMIKDEIMLDAPEESADAVHAREKAARKAARKQKKKDEAAAQAAAGNSEAVFDYANAKSVLHAEDGDDKKKKKKDKKKKSAGFAPFSGMTDAPKGLPRAQKEIAGRSKTFKS